ncbi:hypothetical protein ACLB2K_068950 [Fragaria x ananassa]
MADICFNLGYGGCCVVGKVGRSSGGLAMFWKSHLVVRQIGSSQGHIDVEVTYNGQVIRVTGFYGNPEAQLRHFSWDLLRRIANSIHGPWIIFGDFNELLSMYDKLGGGGRSEALMKNFKEVVEECALQEVEFLGPLFTWKRGSLLERLDRCFINLEAAELFPFFHEAHIDMGASDHLPLVLLSDGRCRDGGGGRKGMRRFQFEPFWAKEQGSKQVVSDCWKDSGNMSDVRGKLVAVAKGLKGWNAATFGNIPRKIRQLSKKLQDWPFDDPDEEVQKQRNEVVMELNKALEIEEAIWRQRSRVTWLEEGDRNTKFFHGYARGRGKKNKVLGVNDNSGVWLESEEAVQKAFSDHFQNLFTSEGCSNLDLVLDAIPQKVTSGMNAGLGKPFTRMEIEEALSQMGPDKAPGEDGLSARFYQTYWDVVGTEITDFCLQVLNDGASLGDLNHTLIALIPKVDNPLNVTDYRPISLCNVLYKLISKAIANRMKGLLSEVISSFQSAFVPGRCIHDNVITAFEVIHSIRCKQTGEDPYCVLKLDISKAYDRVEWFFLRSVMEKLGFSASWIDLVMRCVESVSFSFLWNGKTLGRFSPTRGLRQGDPLSPYLFLLCSKGLTSLLQKADQEGLVHGARVTGSAPAISHLLFADDSLLFGRADLQEITHFKQCLLLYESAAGQKINFQKSAVSFGPGVTSEQKCGLADFLGVMWFLSMSDTWVCQQLKERTKGRCLRRSMNG